MLNKYKIYNQLHQVLFYLVYSRKLTDILISFENTKIANFALLHSTLQKQESSFLHDLWMSQVLFIILRLSYERGNFLSVPFLTKIKNYREREKTPHPADILHLVAQK